MNIIRGSNWTTNSLRILRTSCASKKSFRWQVLINFDLKSLLTKNVLEYSLLGVLLESMNSGGFLVGTADISNGIKCIIINDYQRIKLFCIESRVMRNKPNAQTN